MSDNKVETLAVVICTRNRVEFLRRALASLTKQSMVPEEILVIDNAPEDEGTRRLVEDEFPQMKYILESVPGLDFARNKALRSSECDILAFLDDDAVADENWVEVLKNIFMEFPKAGAVTGRVEALSLETEAQRLFEANGGFSRGKKRIRLPLSGGEALYGLPAPLIAWAVSVGCGCNLALRRTSVLELGGFDDALCMGAVLHGGGDLDIMWRILKADQELIYEPDALAYHEHRREKKAVFRQIEGHQRGLVAFLCKSLVKEKGWGRLSMFLFIFWRLFKPGVRVLKRLLGKDPLPLPVILRIWGNCWLGLAAYPAAKKLARQRSKSYAVVSRSP